MAAHQEQPVPEQQDPWNGPQKDGLYDPQLEKEACGVGFIVAIDGKRTNKVSMWVTGWFSYSTITPPTLEFVSSPPVRGT